MDAALPNSDWRRRVHLIVDFGTGDELGARLVHGALVALIVVNIGALVLESVPSLSQRYARLFQLIELVSLITFTLEYFVRLWTAPEHARYRGLTPWQARGRYALSLPAIVDFLATVPLYLGLVGWNDLKILMIFRLLRFFKLGRYSPGMASLGAALAAERKALVACLVILIGVMLVSATLMHFAEHDVQPDKFGTIPDAMWWAIITLTTVGYGDVFPASPIGKIVASLTAIMGLVMLALPVGIVATAFAQEIHRREFVVTWSMIARMPLFGTLNAAEIAEVMRFLRAQTVKGGATIMRRGEPVQSIFFIASGEVELEDGADCRRLDEGHHFGALTFGDIALTGSSDDAPAVRAVVPTKLLILDDVDFRSMISRHPELVERLCIASRS